MLLRWPCVMSREMKRNVKVASDPTLIPSLFQRKRQNSELPSSRCVCKLLTHPGKVKSFQQTCQSLCSAETDRAYRLRG